MDHLIRILARRAAAENTAETWQLYAKELERLIGVRGEDPTETLVQQFLLLRHAAAQQLLDWSKRYFHDVWCPVGRWSPTGLRWPEPNTWHAQYPQKALTTKEGFEDGKIIAEGFLLCNSGGWLEGEDDDVSNLIIGHLARQHSINLSSFDVDNEKSMWEEVMRVENPRIDFKPTSEIEKYVGVLIRWTISVPLFQA